MLHEGREGQVAGDEGGDAEGAFYEAVTNKILDDLVAALKPRWMKVVADFNVRGGLHTAVTATYGEPPTL